MSPTVRDALGAASEFFGHPITLGVLKDKSRAKPFVRRRWFVMAYLRQHEWSYPKIGDALSMSDHTTVMNGVRQANKLWARDAGFRRWMAAAKLDHNSRKNIILVGHQRLYA